MTVTFYLDGAEYKQSIIYSILVEDKYNGGGKKKEDGAVFHEGAFYSSLKD